MWFNSIDFAIFSIVVFAVYWFVLNNKLKQQNLFLLFASYFFYGFWDWRFLTLIIFSSFLDYNVGLKIFNSETKKQKKSWLLVSLLLNIGLLGFFKYFNFFINSFEELMSLIGFQANITSLNIILPVGISFYTFQTLSYTIDIYRDKIKPIHDIIAFFAFVSFFPQLVAGPIERASNLLPQFLKRRSFNYNSAKDGIRLILWGLFKKIVIADNCALHANEIFSTYQSQDSITLFLGGIYFAFQIYGDFSGYSDIAIGIARLLGFDLMKNFTYPYFSRNISEFWRRWHISLSTWFRDYVFIPLGGSRVKSSKYIRNIILTFTISGLWHGANWTFVFWGFLNGLYYVPLLLTNSNKKYTGVVAQYSWFPNIKEVLQICTTFIFTLIAWIFFRSETIQDAFYYLAGMFSLSLFNIPHIHRSFLPFILVFLLVEWIQRHKDHPLQIDKAPVAIKFAAYASISVLIVLYHVQDVDIEFIYFQF